MTASVIYIARGRDGGLAPARDFLEAWARHPPGFPHRLIVVAKGWTSQLVGPGAFEMLQALSDAVDADLVRLPDDGFDWGAYMRVAPTLREDWLCLLNSHSRPRADGWLRLLQNAAASDGVGAAGATGSWSSWASPWPRAEPDAVGLLLHPARVALALARFARNAGSFPRFPNPHLRSNAIFLRRELFADFARQRRIPSSKRDAHVLESGHEGLSAFLVSRGLALVVAGADGRVHRSPEWIESETFRVPGQAHLLVEDNQTRGYESADRRRRRRLERATWGRTVTP